MGIPTVADRAMQAIARSALEPEWEARFEACSYGFRPGRGCHDAIAKVFNLANPRGRKVWILDADIKGAFDNIGHEALLKAIDGFPARELVKQWLKAGYVESDVLHPTDAGTPQGGVISPLLANIAFHGMEQAIGVKLDGKGQTKGKRALVRYADDFLVFCESREDAEAAKEELAHWLGERGLTLSEEKTRIVHITEGFDFLGFNVRRYPAPKTSRTGWKLLITPSKGAVQKFRDRVRQEWKSLRGTSVAAVLKALNPIIRGWANYYRTVVSKATFNKLDKFMFGRCVRYARHTHPTKPWKWIRDRYFGQLRAGSGNQWVFGDKQRNAHLLKLNWTAIRRHPLVQGRASPDDPDLRDYWNRRQAARMTELPPKLLGLARRQKGWCPQCGQPLVNDEELHVHHRQHRKDGGGDDEANLRLIHLFCHQQVHAGREKEALQLA